MRSTLLAVAVTGAAVLATLGATSAGAAGSAPDRVSGAWIVTLVDDASPGTVARDHARAHGADVSHLYRHALRGYAARMSATAAARVARDARVLRVEPDRVVEATAQALPTGIDRSQAELSTAARINGVDERVDVDVAIIDTGIDLDHPDLNVYRRGAKNCSTGRSADDGNGHGTHVAGTVGALDNTSGVVGMAPGARLWPVRVLNNNGGGSWSSVICGVDYVTAHANEIEVANMSLGGTGDDSGGCSGSSLHQSICNSVAAGVTYVVAAGNDARDAKSFVPAAYDEVITVSALADFDGRSGGLGSPTCRSDEDDTLANFSNFGADVDLIAPGVCIRSTWKGGGLNTISGTSMASPHVAGGAALYLATHPDASPATVKSALQGAGSTDWNSGDDPDGIKERLLDVSTF